jgi:N-acetylmuramoyl-L-alanine amidase
MSRTVEEKANDLKEKAKTASVKDAVKSAASSVDKSQVKASAERAITDTANSIESKLGSVAGEVEGGIKSLKQDFDKFQDKLQNTTVEGLLEDGAESLENMATDFVNDQIANLASKLGLGASIEIQFSEPDSNGIVYPIASSLEADGGVEGTVAAVLQLITGLGVGPGSLQSLVAEASAEGLLAAGQELAVGKIGALSADGINGLVESTINSVVDEFQTTVTDAINNGIVGSINKAVDAITDIDSDGSGGLLLTRSTVTGAMPDALTEFNSAIEKVKTNPLADLKSTITSAKEVKQNLTGAINDFENLTGKDGQEVLESVQRQASSRAKYTAITEEKRSLVRTRVAGGQDLGIIQSLSTSTLLNVTKDVRDFVNPNPITQQEINEVVSKSQGDSRDVDEAARLLERITGKSYNVIKNFLRTIDTTLTNATRPVVANNVFEEPYVIGSYQRTWKKGQGDPIFPYISSVQELEAELVKAEREITEFVVHWTETATNKNIGAEEINKYHLEFGFEGIGYHYVIRRDGSLQRGRPLNLEGQHTDNTGHDQRSIGIVFVGGLNVPSGTPNIQDFVSVQSLTRSQLNTFDHFCRAFFNAWPGGQALGHNDIDTNEEDPGFDVRAYVKQNFGKESKFDDPSSQKPFTIDEINS